MRKSYQILLIFCFCGMLTSCDAFMQGMANAYGYRAPASNQSISSQQNPFNGYKISSFDSSNLKYNPNYNPQPTTTKTQKDDSSLQANYNRTKCPNCDNGRRVYEKSANVTTFGLNTNRKRCNICGKTYDANSTVHYHSDCNTCHGSGYLD